MSDPDEVRIACIGCGSMNPIEAEICSGCGHRFRDPSPAYSAPSPPSNPYEAPRARVGVGPTFRIGSAMVWIAVVALWMGAFAADVRLGILSTLGLLPATIRLMVVSTLRSSEGRPMSVGDQVVCFVGTLGASCMIFLSSIIAFGLTCFPMVGGGADPIVSVVVGVGVAILVPGWITYALLRASRSRAQRERDRDLIRWR